MAKMYIRKVHITWEDGTVNFFESKKNSTSGSLLFCTQVDDTEVIINLLNTRYVKFDPESLKD